MKPELKKALELIKSELSREEIVKALFTDKNGLIDLCNLDLRGLKVFLHGLKAEKISNSKQEAKWIHNEFQKAISIYNCSQKAKEIKNKDQKAESIDNDNQKIMVIPNNDKTTTNSTSESIEQQKIKYSDIMSLGFTEEFVGDSVYQSEYGFEYSIINKDLTNDIYLSWRKETQLCDIYRKDKDDNILSKAPVNSLEHLNEIIDFFKKNTKKDCVIKEMLYICL